MTNETTTTKAAEDRETFREEGAPLVVNFGAGVDSTAMLVELARRGIRPDVVLFADTGSEKPETMAWLRTFSDWLVRNGMPAVTVVRRAKSRPSKTGAGYDSLEGNCLQNATLPSLAFGRKSCSLKWKAEPMDRWLAAREDVRAAWARGARPVKLIGYDCGPADSRRAVDRDGDARFRYVYPLRLWGWDRERCKAEILAAGLPVPPKSACFFCPATKEAELVELATVNRDLFLRALAIEAKALPTLRTVRGLGRKFSWLAWARKAAAAGVIDPLPLGFSEDVDLVAMAAERLAA